MPGTKYLGIRIVIDDAGFGFVSMCYILQIGPDIVKRDVSLTSHMDRDRRAASTYSVVTP